MSTLKNQEKYNIALQEYLNDTTVTLTHLAKKYNFDRACFSRYLKKQGVEVQLTGSSTEIRQKQELALQEYLKGEKSIIQLSKDMNLSEKSLGLYFRKKGIEIRHKPIDTGIEYKLNDNFFDIIDTEQKAYWLGFIFADGYVRVTPSGGHQLYIELQRQDREHLQKFLNDINSNHIIFDRERVTKHKFKSPPKSSFIRINSKDLVKGLMEKGCIQGKTYIGYLDENVFVNNELKYHFLRGYIDGDGSIAKEHHQVSIFIKNDVLTNHVSNLLDDLDIFHRITKTDKYTNFCEYYLEEKKFTINTIYVSRKKEVLKFLTHLYKNAKVFLERKRKIALNKI